MGGTESKTTVKVVNELVTSTMNNIFMEQLQSHKASGGASQVIDVTGASGSVNISGIDMESNVTISLDSWQKMQNTTEIKKIIEQILQQAAETTTEAEGGFFTTGDVSAETNQEIENRIIQDTVNEIGLKQINECLATSYSEQVIRVKDAGGDVSITGINMRITSETAAICVADTISDIYSSNQERYENQQSAAAETRAENKGIFESMAEAITAVLDGLLSIMTGPFRMVLYAVAAVIGIIVLLIVGVTFIG